MHDIELLHEILTIESPWHIVNTSLNKEERRLDIHIGYKGREKKKFFGLARKIGGLEATGDSTCPLCQAILPNNTKYKPIAVRHLPMAGFSTYLFVPPSNTVNSLKTNCSCMRPWRTPGTACTAELFKYVVGMLKTTGNFEQVRAILDLTVDEMQQIRDVTDIPDNKGAQTKENAPPVATESSGIPEFNHPNWMKLVKGDLTVNTEVVALNMLLSRITTAFAKNPNIDSGVESVKVLRQFFTRNKRLLKDEISIINGSVTGKQTDKKQSSTSNSKRSTNNSSLPVASSLAWQLLVQNKIHLKTEQIALQMLLSRVHKTIKNNPTQTTMETEIKKVCSYFLRNESKLANEINQLKTKEITQQ